MPQKVLVIDDDAAFRKILLNILEDNGYLPSGAATGKAGVMMRGSDNQQITSVFAGFDGGSYSLTARTEFGKAAASFLKTPFPGEANWLKLVRRGDRFTALASADDGNAIPSSGTEGFRCGSHIIDNGMALERVQEYCGEPTRQTDDRWIYDRGPDKFTVIIHVQPDNTVGLIEERPHDE